ncbi:MAG: GerW family sporulation protein [Vicinamibacterales bacterium]
MEHVESLLKTALAEIERMLTTKTVVGEPIEVAGNTIVPLVAVGFGFGGGGGVGEDQKSASAKGEGAGTGGGGGIKPVAVVIVDKDGKARVEPIRAAASVVEKIGEAVARVVETREGKGRAPAPSAS